MVQVVRYCPLSPRRLRDVAGCAIKSDDAGRIDRHLTRSRVIRVIALLLVPNVSIAPCHRSEAL
ncbi:protein of unknown function [Pararobbsia alpina]